jgi:hypothetical protein
MGRRCAADRAEWNEAGIADSVAPVRCTDMTADNPNGAEWLTAWSTLGLLIAAAVAAVIAATVAMRERNIRHRSQAESVAAWVGRVDDIPGPFLRDRGRTYGPGFGCVIINSSPLPIYDVQRFYSARSDDGAVKPLAASETLDLVEPGRNVLHVPDEVTDIWRESQLDEKSRTGLRVEIAFRDATDRLWKRDINGVLKRSRKWWWQR